ncbi:YceI family protein [Flavobacterium sp. K5-23]|uniref:YceI family protein n=1 Tax=Flavobacterium sp. K5-23 TaxID=2746225 RepID=UPI00200FFD08|nr:YceI family protein [Flavobacterium sp. K5-23]UQD56597.1 YceI family protein [Flavobacterium sp. K5-23]
MKKLKTIVLALLVLFAFENVEAQTSVIDASKSKITWLGKKLTGQHEGTINLKDGYLVFKDKAVAGGSFTVDMTSISNTDQNGKGKTNLEGHLKSDDFFGVNNFPSSTLVFKTIANKGNNSYTIIADLTIKGITKPIKFDLAVKGNTASTNLVIDRTKYDIRYGSGSFFEDLGNKTIYDNFDLAVELAF